MTIAIGRSLDDVPRLPLLTADPEFARGIPQAEAPVARRALAVPRLDLPRGPWVVDAATPGAATRPPVLVVRGVLAREVLLGGRAATHLIGPGDVVLAGPSDHQLLPAAVRWSVHEPAVAAVLDDRFSLAARRWPSLSLVVEERLAALADRTAAHIAICQLPRVDQRVLAILWQLAERYGRVSLEGVLVPLRLTHQLLGRLVGAQRPTVTLAVQQLSEEGNLQRRADGVWLLSHSSREVLDAAGVVPEIGRGAAARVLDASPDSERQAAPSRDSWVAVIDRSRALSQGFEDRQRSAQLALERARAMRALSAQRRRARERERTVIDDRTASLAAVIAGRGDGAS